MSQLSLHIATLTLPAYCNHPYCETRPVYNKVGSKIAKYCAVHALNKYIDIRHTHCVTPHCKTIPFYGDPSTRIREYCHLHAPKHYKISKYRLCVEFNCVLRAECGYAGYSLEYCNTHKKDKMIRHSRKANKLHCN